MKLNKLILIVLLISLIFIIGFNTTEELSNQLNDLNPNLRHNKLLDEFAQIRFQSFDTIIWHKNFIRDGRIFFTGKININDYMFGEIIDYWYSPFTAKDAIIVWLNSPSHKKVLLNQTYTDYGYYYGFNGSYWIFYINFIGRIK